VVSSQGLRWLLSVPVYDSEFDGPTANHALAGNPADVVAVIGASGTFLHKLAAARYDDVLLAACAITPGRVILFAPHTTAELASGPLVHTVARVRAEGFDVVPAKDLHPWSVTAIVEAILGGQPYDHLLGLQGLAQPAPVPIRVVYALSGAISAVAAPLSLDQLAWSGGFDLRIIATAAARAMVSLEGLRRAYAPASGPMDASEFARWADVVLVNPAAADMVGRLAAGDESDDAASVARDAKRLIVVPATNSRMWARAAVQRAVDTLGRRGAHVVLPLAGPEVADPTAPPGFGSAGVQPASLPGLLRLIAREPVC
jgi:phosphopantothenoylcysteine synthetase/decarboxylase